MNQQLYKYVYSQPVSVLVNRVVQNIKSPFTGGEVEYAVLFGACATGDLIYVAPDMSIAVTPPAFTTDKNAGPWEGYIIPGGVSAPMVPIFSSIKDNVGVIASGSAGDMGVVILVFRQRIVIKSYVEQDTSMTGTQEDHFSKSGYQRGTQQPIRKLAPNTKGSF